MMPAKGILSQEQKEQLQTTLRSDECPRLRSHALILLLQNDGKTYEEIADFIGCGYRTVAYWCVHGDPDNFDSLRGKRQQGNYRKATEEYIALLQEVVEKPPSEFGYGIWLLTKFHGWQSHTAIRVCRRKDSPDNTRNFAQMDS